MNSKKYLEVNFFLNTKKFKDFINKSGKIQKKNYIYSTQLKKKLRKISKHLEILGLYYQSYIYI